MIADVEHLPVGVDGDELVDAAADQRIADEAQHFAGDRRVDPPALLAERLE